MASEGVQVGVVLDPARLKLVTGMREQTLQQIESLLYLAQASVDAGGIVLSKNIVRVDGQRSR